MDVNESSNSSMPQSVRCGTLVDRLANRVQHLRSKDTQ